jgi:hypothetical protein
LVPAALSGVSSRACDNPLHALMQPAEKARGEASGDAGNGLKNRDFRQNP